MCRVILTLKDLSDVKQAEYPEWNTSSVGAIFATIVEYTEGSEERDLALKILKGFCEWRKEQPAEYLPRRGLEFMYSNEYLQEAYEYVLAHPLPSEEEPLKKHNEFKKGLRETFESLRAKYPTKIVTQEDLLNKQQPQKPYTLRERIIHWNIRNPIRAFQIISGLIFVTGFAIGIGSYALFCLKN